MTSYPSAPDPSGPVRLLRRLPVPVPLVAAESYQSFVARLAEANHLPSDVLAELIAARRPISVQDVSWLAVLSGYPAGRLRQVLSIGPAPDAHSWRLACRFCTARRGIHRRVVICAAGHEQVCARHRRWLGESSDPRHQDTDLQPVPEVMAAHHRHRRMVRRHHDRDAVQEAFGAADHILFRWTARRDWPEHRDRRLRHLVDLDGKRATEHHPLTALANYPETVALTQLLCDPAMVGRAVWDTRDGLERFCQAVRERLKIPYEPYHARDPLVVFIEKQCHAARRFDPLDTTHVGTCLGRLWSH